MLALLTSLALAGFTLPEAVRLGDCPSVVGYAPDSPAARLAVGTCLNRLGRTDEALVLLEEAPPGPLEDYFRWQAAQALYAKGDLVAAWDRVGAMWLPGRAGDEQRLLRARILLAVGRSLDARQDLRDLLGTEVASEARFLLAEGAVSRQDLDAAISTFERTWALAGPWADRAAARLAELDHPVPDFATERGRALVEERIDALTASNRHDEALALARELHAVAPFTPLKWAERLFAARAYEEAVVAFRGAMGAPDQAMGLPEALVDYALAVVRSGGSYDDAIRIYERLIAQHPNAPMADLASFKLGYLEVDRNRCDAALERFEAHLKARPASRHRDEAWWWMARCAHKAGDDAKASELWGRLLADSPASSLAPGAAYWRARIDSDPEKRRNGLLGVVEKWPDSGYAWFAAERLGLPFDASAADTPPFWPDLLRDSPSIQRAEALHAAGFDRWALDELQPVLLQIDRGSAPQALSTAEALLRMGDYREARILAAPYCKLPGATTLCAPRPASGIVAEVAPRFGVDPSILYGIMLAESDLDPSVTSAAGARGLMQLMPAEGQRLHELVFADSTEYHPDRLYDAPYNAALGTAELGSKLESLGDALEGPDIVAAIAAYNGGLDAVRRWLGGFDSPPPFDEFAEDIGFTETRQYVKRVLGFAMVYRRTYGDGGR